MNIEYRPNGNRREQWIITDGPTVAKVCRTDAASALRSQGLSISAANIKLAEAKLRAAQTTAAV
jgi:hypothetical protein